MSTRIVEDPVPQERLRVGPVEIAYRIRPTADRRGAVTLLVLHGFTGQGGDWAAVCDELAQAGHGSICPDHPGHGRSDAPDDPRAYAMEAVADMYNALCEHLATGPVVVLGHSMGGAVAEQFALRHRDTTRALILADSVGGSRKDDWSRVLAGYSKLKLKTIAFEQGMGALYDYQIASGRRVVDHIPEALRPLVREHFAATSPTGYFHAAAAMSERNDTLAGLRAFDAPALVMVGEGEDPGFIAGSREIDAHLVRSRFAFIEGAAHNPHFEAPEATAAIVADFLNSLDSLDGGDASPC